MAVSAPAREQPTNEELIRVLSTALDVNFYGEVYPDLEGVGSLLRHYVELGWREGRDPAPWFSTRDYLADAPDVAAAGVEPLYHYLTRGRREGRVPRASKLADDYYRMGAWTPSGWRPSEPPDVDETLSPARQREAIAAEFDPSAYLEANPQIAETGADPLTHFLTEGWREGRDPGPDFSVRYYLETNPDVAQAADLNPYAHYLIVGRDEGRAPRAVPRTVRDIFPDYDLVAAQFDPEFYLAQCPDVAEAGWDPVEHFLQFGWREKRDPTPNFSVVTYLAAFPEVAAAEVNPYVHYLKSGRPLAYPPEPPLGFRFDIISDLQPIEERVRIATSGQVELRPADELAAALADAPDGLRRVHVTFSHDPVTGHVGGLQQTIEREAARLREQGRDHLHLYPSKPWPVVRTSQDPGDLGVVLNGRNLGLFAVADVRARLAAAGGGAPPGGRSFAIHSLLGHAADEVADVLGALGLRAGAFWLHDFASLCAGFHLLRNDVQDCAAPPPESAACAICVYGPWRARHLSEHEKLFQRLDLTVAAPAQATLDLWRRAATVRAAATALLPHARLVNARPAPPPEADRPFVLAYAGLPVAHKGWHAFRALVTRFQADPRYRLVHLGSRRDRSLPVEFHRVVVSPEQPNAMQNALRDLAPDAVLLWPLCRETFSFVAYEAVAAGCALITSPDSGNVQAFVLETGAGIVLPDEDALKSAFEAGEVLPLRRAVRRPQMYDLSYSALSLDLPTQGSAP